MQDPLDLPPSKNESLQSSKSFSANHSEDSLVLPSHNALPHTLKHFASSLLQVRNLRLQMPLALRDEFEAARVFNLLVSISQTPIADRVFTTIQKAVLELPCYPKLAEDVVEFFAHVSTLPGTHDDYERLESFIFSLSEPLQTEKSRFEYISKYFRELKKSDRCSSVSQSTFLEFLTQGDRLFATIGNSNRERTLACTVLGNLLAYRGSFQGAHFILPLFSRGVKNKELVLHTFECGLAVGDPPEQIALLAKALGKLILDYNLDSALFIATVQEFRDASTSLLPLLSSLSILSKDLDSSNQHIQAFDRLLIANSILLRYKIPSKQIDQKSWERICFRETQIFEEDFLTHAEQVATCLRTLKKEFFEGYETYSKVTQLITIPPCRQKMRELHHIFELPQCHFTDFDDAVSILCDLAQDQSFETRHWHALSELIHAQIQKGRNVDELLCSVKKLAVGSRAHYDTHSCIWDEYFSTALLLRTSLSDLAAITPNVLGFFRSASTEEKSHTAHQLFQLAFTLRDQGHSAKHHITEVTDSLFSPSGLGELYLRSLGYHTKIGRDTSRLIRSFLDLPLEQDNFYTYSLIECVTRQIAHSLPLTGVFTAFADFTNAHRPSSQQWRSIRQLISQLIHDDIPLTFLSSTHLQRCNTPFYDDTAYSEITNHLRELSNLHSSRADITTQASIEELLLLISHQGPEMQGVKALEKIIQLSGDDYLEPLQELWELHSLPSQEGWLCILENCARYADSGLSIFHLCRDITLLNKKVSASEPARGNYWRNFREIIHSLNYSQQKDGTVGLPLTLLTHSFIQEFHLWNASQKRQALSLLISFSRFYLSLSAAHDEENYYLYSSEYSSRLKTHLSFCLNSIPDVLENPALSQKIMLIVDQGTSSLLQDFSNMLREIHAYALTLQLRDTSNPELQNRANEEFGATFFTSQGMYLPESDEARVHHNKTMRIIDRAFRDYASFGGSALSTRRPPKTEKLESVAPMMVRFGLHSADRTYILNSSSNNSFPGKGICIEGLRTERVFRTDPHWKEQQKSSPHWRWLESGGLFSNSYFHTFDMEELAECSFIQLRGVEIVLPPPRSKYQIDGVQYGYLFYNRHFAPFPEIALGVPVSLIRDLLGSSLIPADDFTGFDTRRTDLSKVDLSYNGIKKECQRRGIPLLNLTYGSVIGSGLCNAPLPKTEPYYGWELSISERNMLSDAWGHIHKSVLQIYPFHSPSSFDERTQFAKDLQENIYSYFHHLQDYRTALRFAFSFYKMGTTFTNDAEVTAHTSHSPATHTKANNFEGAIQSDSFSPLTSADSQTHSYEYRMLEEVYRYHLGGLAQGWKDAEFPVLHFPITLRPDILPSKSTRLFSIDTQTLEITLQDQRVPLPIDGNGMSAEEQQIWREVVLPIFRRYSIGWDPTFLLPEN